MKLTAKFVPQKLTVSIDTKAASIKTAAQVTRDYVDVEPYTGEYEVIPDTEAQVLPTENKRMVADLTVTAIPYYEVSNQNGTTVYIADRLENL